MYSNSVICNITIPKYLNEQEEVLVLMLFISKIRYMHKKLLLKIGSVDGPHFPFTVKFKIRISTHAKQFFSFVKYIFWSTF